MDFEPLEDELEEALLDLIELQSNGIVEQDHLPSIEQKELERLGYIEEINQFISGESRVVLSYNGLKYPSRKEKWKKEQRIDGVKKAAGGIAEKAAEAVASAALKNAGL